ncbi:MAG: KH domain-containing protein [Candidatus Methylomirabilales bacterium]
MLKELVEYLARALVDNPDAVTVEAIEDEKTTTLKLKVAQPDLGRVIGKQGRTARAMRSLLHAAAAKSRRRAVLEIVE